MNLRRETSRGGLFPARRLLLLAAAVVLAAFPGTVSASSPDPAHAAAAPAKAGEGAHEESLGHRIPIGWVTPFALLLLGIAVLPLAVPHWWDHNKNKAILSVVLGVPVVIYLGLQGHHGIEELVKTLKEYIAFIILLAALFVISGGVYLRGSLTGTPLVNTFLLAIGAVIASFIGTTGASMLLIRPLLRANEKRKARAHIVVFFIFIVSNAGGLLTPLGDPPLFLGFLRGVPFEWTFKLAPEWGLVNGILLVMFNLLDQFKFNREEEAEPTSLGDAVAKHEPLSVEGKINFLFLGGVVLAAFLAGYLGKEQGWSENTQKGVQVAAMLVMAGLSMKFTSPAVRRDNKFNFAPIIEVAVLFAGIFATMVPALLILEARGGELGLKEPWHFFWGAGMLSSFLDNAPTYLTYTSAASGLLGTSKDHLEQLLGAGGGPRLLQAVSCGAVFMGANTYIGNGPNFMVKAVAENSGVKMPSFFGYMGYAAVFLIPVWVLVTFVFFR